ncbi:MAG: hypothetical protein QM767_09650 [Anaeromyxobacter sp.]
MHPATSATLARLRGIEWFRSVGSAQSPNIVSVHDWDAAMASCVDPLWEEAQQAARGTLEEQLMLVSPELYVGWNDIVKDIRPAVQELVREKTRVAGPRAVKDSKLFLDNVHWDILHLALEAEFSEFVQPAFYARLGYWYHAGHWPCGWEGALDSGRLIVF